MDAGLILTGTRGAGKTTVAVELQRRGVAAAVPAVTTRPRRPDDAPGAYEHLTPEQLDAEDRSAGLLVRSEYGIHAYAIRRAAVRDLLHSSRTPVLTITPESALRLVAHDRTAGWRAVFLDADDDVLDQRLTRRGTPPDDQDRQQRVDDRSNNRPPLIPVANDGDLNEAVSAVLHVLD
jgi:guanylate kinase